MMPEEGSERLTILTVFQFPQQLKEKIGFKLVSTDALYSLRRFLCS